MERAHSFTDKTHTHTHTRTVCQYLCQVTVHMFCLTHATWMYYSSLMHMAHPRWSLSQQDTVNFFTQAEIARWHEWPTFHLHYHLILQSLSAWKHLYVAEEERWHPSPVNHTFLLQYMKDSLSSVSTKSTSFLVALLLQIKQQILHSLDPGLLSLIRWQSRNSFRGPQV